MEFQSIPSAVWYTTNINYSTAAVHLTYAPLFRSTKMGEKFQIRIYDWKIIKIMYFSKTFIGSYDHHVSNPPKGICLLKFIS